MMISKVLIDTALWYQKLRLSTNDAFFPLYKNQSRYLVLKGGAGSGKSIFAGRKILERIVSEEEHRALVLRKVARTIRESCFAQLVGQISEHYNISEFKINKTDMTITHLNGSQIIFAGLDDVEKLKSIYNITMMWIEEASEINQADFHQLDLRLRGATKYYKQIIFTFNPVDINHWLKKRFFDVPYNNVTTHHSVYKDNRFLDDEAKKVLESYKDSDEYYYTVYCLGEWGTFGKSIFNASAISERLRQIAPPMKTGLFQKNLEFALEENGYIKIYCESADKIPYVIGADTAGDGSDYSTAQVIDNITGEQVAVMRANIDEDVFAKQVYSLAVYYNNALVGIEANFSSYPIKELERMGYANQYVRITEDSFTHKPKRSFGFKTTKITRPIIIAQLVKLMRDNIFLINDRLTLEEMLSFVRNEKGRAEAQRGSHDDLVMALAIAYYIREQQCFEIEEIKSNIYVPFFSDEQEENSSKDLSII